MVVHAVKLGPKMVIVGLHKKETLFVPPMIKVVQNTYQTQFCNLGLARPQRISVQTT